ncbi:MAG TPA: sulfotransferase domain-containing protein [Terriglobales bacterium]|nr:sulfotransferase domain-containing protein [Terriglobales bacterium]
MLIRLTYLLNYLLRRDIAGRTLIKFPDDIFLVAYPGSGGQWLRRLVGNLIDPERPLTEGSVLRRIPDLYHLARGRFKRMPRPRMIFSHECLDAAGHVRVVYLVRDPRDVALSNFEQRLRGGAINAGTSLEQFVATVFMKTDEYRGGWAEEFSGAILAKQRWQRCLLKDDFLGTPASWGENVMSWLGGRGHDSKTLLMLRYEDLVANPVETLTRVSDYLDLGVSGERVNLAVAASRNGGRAAAEPEAPGRWRTRLPEPAVLQIESVWGPLMEALGYAPARVKVSA